MKFGNIEPGTIGKPQNLGRDGRHGVVVVLAEKTEIDLGKGVDVGDEARLEDFFSGTHKGWMIRRISSQLQTEVCIDGGAIVRWAVGINRPAAVFVLMLQDPVRSFLEAIGVSRSQQRV